MRYVRAGDPLDWKMAAASVLRLPPPLSLSLGIDTIASDTLAKQIPADLRCGRRMKRSIRTSGRWNSTQSVNVSPGRIVAAKLREGTDSNPLPFILASLKCLLGLSSLMESEIENTLGSGLRYTRGPRFKSL